MTTAKNAPLTIALRNATADDHVATETLTREAFWDIYKPGCDEHLVLHRLRRSPAFVPELDLVACAGDALVGSIVYSRASVRDADAEHAVLCMGPLCVSPAHQRKGIASLLLSETLCRARKLGHAGVIIFGDPDFYRRFGFRDAAEFGIATADGDNFAAFMALELAPGRLQRVRGRFFADPAFEVDADELAAFEARFPFREKHVLPGQLFAH